jgi:hypothetical protein
MYICQCKGIYFSGNLFSELFSPSICQAKCNFAEFFFQFEPEFLDFDNCLLYLWNCTDNFGYQKGYKTYD